MDQIYIKGGKALEGKVEIAGSKNSTLPLLFSTLLASGSHVFHNASKVKDVATGINLLKSFGCEVFWKGTSLTVVVPKEIKCFTAHYDLMRTMRAGVLCLGVLLSRYGKAQVSLPGGCAIGTRPVNWHIENLEKMGAVIEIQKGYIYGESSLPLKSAQIVLEKPSVGATQNLLMASVLADGWTEISHAACEPEVIDLAHYLKKMGAVIEGEGTNTIKVQGVSSLTPSEHTIIPDRIEAATLLIAGAITHGEVSVYKCNPSHLIHVIEKLEQSGFQIQKGENWIHLKSPKEFSAVDISTSFYPGFPTDLQAQFMALMTQAEGESVIEECIFENRFMHVPELMRLNAHITTHGNKAKICPSLLKGAVVMATDLRASSCLILAGLAAEGETYVRRVYHLDRGYDKLEKKLASLGADIKRI